MKADYSKLRQGIRHAGLAGACVLLLEPSVFGTAASSPSLRRDVLIDLSSEAIPAASADRTLVVDAQSALKKDESFTNATKVVEYRYRLDTSSDMLRLDVCGEIKHGLLRWELIDPTGEVRANIGTTERASMNTSNIPAIKGEWVLRITLQDATGSYKIHWIQ
jgi:hypothetical protein